MSRKVKDRVEKPPAIVILTDANVLINLIHIGQLDLLKRLPGYRFLVPEHVIAEINHEDQTDSLAEAIKTQVMEATVITDLNEMSLYAELHQTLGQGESACLAIAVHRGFSIASDEKRVFRRMTIEKIGEERLLTTEDLIVSAINAGLATVAQADQWKRELENRRFKMKLQSFQDLL